MKIAPNFNIVWSLASVVAAHAAWQRVSAVRRAAGQLPLSTVALMAAQRYHLPLASGGLRDEALPPGAGGAAHGCTPPRS